MAENHDFSGSVFAFRFTLRGEISSIRFRVYGRGKVKVKDCHTKSK